MLCFCERTVGIVGTSDVRISLFTGSERVADPHKNPSPGGISHREYPLALVMEHAHRV